MEGERAAPGDEGGAGQGPPSVSSSSSFATVSVPLLCYRLGFLRIFRRRLLLPMHPLPY